jgi:hypothetical protein
VEEQSTLSTGLPPAARTRWRSLGDLFGAAPQAPRKPKTAKPIKRVFNITLTQPGPFAFAGVGLHSIPGILLFDIICCTKIPEFSKACALKNRIGIDAAT